MKYRTKLYLFFLAIALISIISSLAIIIVESRQAIFEQLQSKTIVVAAGTSIHINGNLIKEIQSESDQEKASYKDLQNELRKHRDTHRRKDLYVKYLYITKPDPNDPTKFIFVVDSEEKKADFSPVGQENPGATKEFLYDHLEEPYSYGEMVSDQWGMWLTGYYPIFDSSGKYVATIGADVSAKTVHAALNRILIFAIGSFVISLLFAMLGATFLSRHATKALDLLVNATQAIAKSNFMYRVHLKSKDEFDTLGNALNSMCEKLQETEKLKIGFAQYVSKPVLDQIIKQKGKAKLVGEKRKISVLFADIRGFTNISEQMPPEEVVKLLNEYFKLMLDVIFKHNGMLDKLIGDGIMAEFGVPIDDPHQEKNAVSAAIEMLQSLGELKKKWKSEKKPEINIGIGIYTGEAIVGNIGSEERMEYTAIGDTVNIAARLQAYTKETPFPIIIGGSTFSAVKNDFPYKELGAITLPGREQTIQAFAILHPGFDAGSSKPSAIYPKK